MSATTIQPLQFRRIDPVEAADKGPLRDFSAAPAAKPNEQERLQQLERMLAEAQDRAAIAEREAYDKAYAAGEKAGLALGNKRAEQILASMQQAADSMDTQLQALHKGLADLVVEIAGGIARRVVGEVIDRDPQLLWAMAREVSDRLPSMSELKLAVHPDELAMFRRLMEEGQQNFVLVAEPSLAPGSCRIVCRQNDVLIDPQAAVDGCIGQLRETLLRSVPAARE